MELTEEREGHIAAQHPDLLPRHKDRLAETLADPDQMRIGSRSATARLISRWFASVLGGKHVVVVVVSDHDDGRRDWERVSEPRGVTMRLPGIGEPMMPCSTEDADTAAEIIRLEHAWMEAAQAHDAAALERLMAEEYRLEVMTLPRGHHAVYERASWIAETLAPHHPRVRLH